MTNKRAPEHIAPAKMHKLATLPLFHNLMGKKVIVAGHGNGAIWKAELVAATGANVVLFLGSEITPEHERVFANLKNVTLLSRAWNEADLVSAHLAIAESIDLTDANAFVAASKAAGALVNIIDKPSLCDFQFGAIVNRSPLVIGISTNGAAPALGQTLRGRFEAMFPTGIAKWAQMAAQWRPIIKQKELEFGERRAFWHRFAQKALLEPTREPDEDDLAELLKPTPRLQGKVALVGAGPGDAELLTLKAVRALQNAEVILFDDLVTQDVLDFARREAQFIAVGKRGKRPSTAQEDICETLIMHARDGKYVVRIKGGDPLIFGRATEEIAACRAANIPITIIPGISAAQSAAAALGISLTDRVHAQRVQFVTGAGKKGGLPPQIDWKAIASDDTTTFVYMPRATITDFVKNAKMAGLSPQTPAAIIIDATRPEQKIHITNLDGLEREFSKFEADGPEIVMIGNVINNAQILKS